MISAEYETIYEEYRRGRFEVALAMARHRLRRDRHDGRAWELLGLVQFALGRTRDAVSALERASLLVPLRPAARVCLGHAYGKVGRKELSRDLLTELIDDEAMSCPLLLKIASGLDAIDRPCLAMRACRKATEREPEAAQAYFDLGYYSARCGLPAHVAESLAKKAISLAPENVPFRVGLASLLIRQERRREAYRLVENFSNEQIRRIACACCLRRIIGLYEAARDYRRTIVGQEHLLRLELRGIAETCD